VEGRFAVMEAAGCVGVFGRLEAILEGIQIAKFFLH